MNKNRIKAMVICGFPGIGKSTCANNKCNMDDAESSAFSHIFDPEHPDIRKKNPAFPQNYIDHIKTMAGVYGYDFVLVSSHKEVRKALRDNGIPYIVVVPKKELKDEYLKRYIKRGSPQPFVDLLYHKWNEFLNEIEEESAPVVHLEAGEFLSDVLP